jgi:hypothetical protein
MYLKMGRHVIAICSGFAFWLCTASGCLAQTSVAAKPQAPHPARSVSTPAEQTPVKGDKTEIQSAAADIAAQPAKITLKDGKLTIVANNSDLAQILKNLSDMNGMTVQGLSRSPRIFGVYGPGSSREVLTSMLASSGYNFIIVGGANDVAPLKVLLAPITAASGEASHEADRVDPKQHEQEPEASEERGPGAVYPVPPQPPQDEGTRTEQNLQRLQHLQEQQNPPQ